jgi:hypothetical protein
MTKSTGKCKVCGSACNQDAGIKVPIGWFCGYAHLFEYQREKTAKSRERQTAKALLKRKADVKPLSYWMKRAQSAVNAWIRASKGSQCISCGRYHDGQMHAGHYRSTAAAPEIRFEPDNIWPQCQPCNVHLSANIIRYRPALIAKIGLERVEWLEGLHEPKRYRREDYQAIEAEYKVKLKELKQQVEG